MQNINQTFRNLIGRNPDHTRKETVINCRNTLTYPLMFCYVKITSSPNWTIFFLHLLLVPIVSPGTSLPESSVPGLRKKGGQCLWLPLSCVIDVICPRDEDPSSSRQVFFVNSVVNVSVANMWECSSHGQPPSFIIRACAPAKTELHIHPIYDSFYGNILK